MKNLMSRDEYLQKANEGFIKDTIKKGWEKVKSFFSLGFKKIKDFLAVVDNKGNVFPVVSFQATIDKASGVESVEVYAPSALSDTVVEAGGNGCEENAPLRDNDEIYNYGPDGRDEYIQWLKDKKFKEEPEYKNMLTLTKMVAESAGASADELQKLFESWEGVKKARTTLVDNKELAGTRQIQSEEFTKILNRKINDWSVRRGEARVSVVNGVRREGNVMPNILVFGAPGIGKSTVPNAVVKEYNSHLTNPEDMISIISINCANLKAGDFMMPTMPREVNITHEIEDFKDAFPQASAALAELNDEQKKKVADMIYQSNQFKATDAPKTWLPSYRRTGNDFIDNLLNDAANGGVYKADGKSIKVGGGGILLFDEFLRCDPDVFGELMNFLLDRQLNGWILGDRWTIIACSNRPQDDGKVAETWGEWYGAAKDRWGKIYQLVPEPEEWKKWARSKGCDELLLDFIFEESDESKGGKEYARWHSIVTNGAGSSHQTKPISPREWERVFTEFIDYEIEMGYSDISEMNMKEIDEVLAGSFDDEFVEVIKDWLRDHKDKVDLDAIMKDPEGTYLPKKFANDPAKAIIMVRNLYKEFEGRYKDDPEDCSEDQLANIIAWIGINYRDDMLVLNNFMEDLVTNIYKNNTEYRITKYPKVMLTAWAAYPEVGFEEELDGFINAEKKIVPENAMDIIKDMMRKYFPWRIDGDKINYCDNLDTDTDIKDAKVTSDVNGE